MAIKTYLYKTVDSEQHLAADVHYPTPKPINPVPIALVIHGGGFVAGSKEHVPANQFETLVELGFVAVSVNYRLAPTISLYDGPFTDSKDCFLWCKTTLPQLLEDDTGIVVDPSRIVTLGHSAGGNLALSMARNTEPPLAILDFYGAKYLSDDFWHRKDDKMQIPDFPQDFVDKIWSEVPPPSGSAIHQSELAEQEVSLDFSQPRNAWLVSSIAKGSLMRDVVKDGDYARVDPVTFFSKTFPPTFFIHGTVDRAVPIRFSEQAHEELKRLGVETELRPVKDEDHAFDEKLKKSDPHFAIVKEGLEFLARHAQARV